MNRTAIALVLLPLLGACGSDATATGDDAPTTPASPGGGSGSGSGSGGSGSGSGTATPAPPAPPPLGAPYPIVLMHGMSGFGQLGLGPVTITYFDGVVEDLTKRGEAVFVTVVPPYDTSEERAAALAPQIDAILKKTGKAKVNLVAHSQGGIDARLLTSPQGLGYGDRVASVTTIATPHRGSKVADVVLGLVSGIPNSVVDDVTSALLSLVEKSAFELQTDPHLRAQVNELSETFMANVFNPKYLDAPGVAYTSYGGRTNLRTGIGVCDDGVYANHPLDVDVAQAPLEPLAIFLEEGQFKVNDGLVTVASAKWGTFQSCVPADHLKEVGQLAPAAASFDHLQLFRDIVTRVHGAGY